MRKGFAPIVILVVVALVVAAGGIAYWQFKSKTAVKNQSPSQTIQSTPTSSPAQVTQSLQSGETSNWKTYKNDKVGFQFDYPSKYSKASYEDRSTGKFKDFNGVDEKRDVVFGEPLALSITNDNDQVRLLLNIGKGKPGDKATLSDIADVSLGLLDEATRTKVQKEKISVVGAEGLQTKLGGLTIGTFFLYKDYVIDLSLVPSTPKATQNESEYQKIIKSFTFNK